MTETTTITDKTKEIRSKTRRRIGEQLREARTKADLTIRDVEEKSGVSKNIICRTEGGRANTGIDTIAAIAAVYGMSLAIVNKDVL